MTPTALVLALIALLLAGLAFGAILLNVPPLWTALAVVIAAAGALAVATARPRAKAPDNGPPRDRTHY